MSSFKRRASTRQAQLYPGTRTSSSTIILSTGIPSFDDLLGGGLPLSCTSVVLAPDPHSAYGVLVQKYFISQGLAWDHHVCVVDADARALLQECMWMPNANGSPNFDEQGDDDGTEADSVDSIKIAWRYKQMKQFTTTVATGSIASEQFCRTIDLSCKLPEAIVEQAERNGTLSFVDVNTAEPGQRSTTKVIDLLSSFLNEFPPTSGTTDAIRPLRVVIPALGSLEWGDLGNEDILFVLHSLRALLRQYPFACASISLSPHASTDAWGGVGWIQKIGWLSDAAITLSAFSGDPSLSATFPSHHGLLHTLSLPAPHTILPPSDKFSTLRGLSPCAVSAGGGSGENNLAFKCTRKRLIFETLHLDLEGGVGERRTTPSVNATALDAGLSAHGHDADSSEIASTIRTSSVAAVQVELDASSVEATVPELHEEVKPPTVGEKPKKTKKRVAFHSDKPDLYDF